jgi:ribosomal protein L7Ae-like RNA K-turn-binding protein
MNRIAGLLGMAAKSGQLLAGTAAVEAAIKNRKVLLVICANDLSPKTVKNFNYFCQTYQIAFYTYASIAEIGHWIGRPGRGVLGVKSVEMARAIKVLLEERPGDPLLIKPE